MQDVRIRLSADTRDAQQGVKKLEQDLKRLQGNKAGSTTEGNTPSRRELDELREIQAGISKDSGTYINNLINQCRQLKRESQKLQQAIQDSASKQSKQLYESKLRELEAQKRIIETNISTARQLSNNHQSSVPSSSPGSSPGVPSPSSGSNPNNAIKDLTRKLVYFGTIIKGTQMAYSYISQGAAGATNSESAVQRMANRTGYYGSNFEKGRADLYAMSKDLGYSAADTAQQAQSYMSIAGVKDYYTMLQDTRAIQEFSKANGVDINSMSALSGQLVKTGTLKEGEQRKFANVLAESIKRDGMTGREEEQIQVLKDLSTSISSNKVSVSQTDMLTTMGFYERLAQSNEQFKGTKGADVTSTINDSIVNGDQQMDVLLGWGTKYRGVEDRWDFELQKSKGLTDPENLSTVLSNMEKFTGNAPDSAYGKLMLKDKLGLDPQVVEEIVSNKDLLEALKAGTYGKEDLNKILESAKTGSDTLKNAVKNYKDSTLAAVEQYGQTKSETKESVGSSIQNVTEGFMGWRNGLSTGANTAIDAAGGAAKLGIGAGASYFGARSATAGLSRLLGHGAGASGATAVGGTLGSALLGGATLAGAGVLLVDAYKEGHRKSDVIEKNVERVSDKKAQSTDYAWYAENLAKQQGMSDEVLQIFANAKGEYSGFEQSLSEIKKLTNPEEQQQALKIAMEALKATDKVKATMGKADEAVKPIGSHATGDYYVPEDKIDRVHKGEAILDKFEADEWRKSKTSSGMNSTYNGKSATTTSQYSSQYSSQYDPANLNTKKIQQQKDYRELLKKEEELLTRHEKLELYKDKNLIKQERLSDNLDTQDNELQELSGRRNTSVFSRLLSFVGLGSQGKSSSSSSSGGIFGSKNSSSSGGGIFNTSNYKYNWDDQYTSKYGSDEKMKLRRYSNLTADDMNKLIDATVGSSEKATGRTSLFRGQGQAFIDAYKATGINPVDLFSHASLESGNGTSNIAYNKHNFFGIGAFDASPYASAYNFGDDSKNKTAAGIVEGAKWIAKNYTDKGQDSYYSMRWNNGSHQYATDSDWDTKIASIRNKSMSILSSLGADVSTTNKVETAKLETQLPVQTASKASKGYDSMPDSVFQESLANKSDSKQEIVVTLKGGVAGMNKQNEDKIANAVANTITGTKDDNLLNTLSSGIVRGLR